MSALYAFCREVDDVADHESASVEEKRQQLAAWRTDIKAACNQGSPSYPVNRELKPFIAQYRLPFDYFDELIRGVEMDLDIHRYDSFADLEHYCYRVASVVGLLSIEIFGYQNSASKEYAVSLGKALQLTNILRDVGVDARRGRVYLPLGELQSCRVSVDEILRCEYSSRFCELAQQVATRAREHYRHARSMLPHEDQRSMVAAELMGAVYWRLLRKLEAARFQVLGTRPLRLSRIHKLALIARAWWAQITRIAGPSYGTG
jgi:phytoene synthase